MTWILEKHLMLVSTCIWQSDMYSGTLSDIFEVSETHRAGEEGRNEERKDSWQLTWKSRVPHLAPGKLQKSRQCRPRMLHNALSKQQWRRHALHSLRIGLLEVRAGSSDNLDESGWIWMVICNKQILGQLPQTRSRCSGTSWQRSRSAGVLEVCAGSFIIFVLKKHQSWSFVNHPSPSRYISLPGFHFIRTPAKRLTQQSSRSKLW